MTGALCTTFHFTVLAPQYATVDLLSDVRFL